MDWLLIEVLICGGLGGFSLALGRLLISYVHIAHVDDRNTKQFLLAQLVPLIGLTILGMIVAWVTANPPISPFLAGVGALGFILMLTREYQFQEHRKEQNDV